MSVPALPTDRFADAVAGLRVPGMGTEAVAPLLAGLVRFARPRTVLEVGMGYTTPFLAAALAETQAQVRAESAALAEKNRGYLDGDTPFDETWLYAEPPLLTPAFYLEPYTTRLVAVDNLSIAESSAPRVLEVLRELGLDQQVTVVNADLRECRELLPADFAPIDLAWVDAWECLFFFDHFWDLINPDGGLVVMHYLMTYPEGEAILDYIAKVQRARPGELEVVNLLEPHKLAQNSLTILRRTTAGKAPSHADPGGRLRYDGPLRDAAATHLDLP
ncbi:class I SAM-dependent methyltransferase [Actinokineospora sp. NBRC 105648]|uniref:class I SAM-dependent methyltransferase n=1 Tax=Actinokineospora sp. NBRC 105648 TaxID=3032206 RepID=UPI0024A10F17|nr:class I SAM-dependent methyltransferase [Actinokineospora sp. NBRC 105648]GLZ39705.1 hypothetical protein Acsp05_33290 [Actinokineospora sp. NBRC 105648]